MVSWPPEKRLAAISAASCTSGVEPSGKVAVARPVNTSLRGLARRSSMYWLKRSYRNSSGLCVISSMSRRQPPAEQRVIGFGDAFQIGNDRQGEGLRIGADHLARPGVEEPVDEAVGVAPHEVLVFLEALRRDEPHQQVAMGRVVRRVERGQLVAERQLGLGSAR